MLGSARVMDSLKNIGLNLYERRLWVALLAKGTASAGELSALANVPRSRTYDILQSLADKGFVIVQTSKPIHFVAVAPEEALERVKKKQAEDLQVLQERIDELKDSSMMRELNETFTKGLKTVIPEEITGALKGKYSVHQQIGTMFKSASQRINMVVSPEGLNEIFENHFESLKKAKERGVEIKIATTANERSADAVKALGGVAEIRNIDEKESTIAGRIMLVDGKEMVVGLTDPKTVHNTQDVAIWSKSEHATGKLFEPIFKLVWNSAKPVS